MRAATCRCEPICRTVLHQLSGGLTQLRRRRVVDTVCTVLVQVEPLKPASIQVHVVRHYSQSSIRCAAPDQPVKVLLWMLFPGALVCGRGDAGAVPAGRRGHARQLRLHRAHPQQCRHRAPARDQLPAARVHRVRRPHALLHRADRAAVQQ